ncbi:MAG: protein kinase, partial [Oscillospiraceae bacterium]
MEKRCFACMNKIDANICSHCGTNNNNLSEVTKDQLTPGTVLRERFYIGFLIDQNGEGITYIAFDMQEKKRVRIREFLPTNFCKRSHDGVMVNVSAGCEIQFKSLKTDFAELSKQLIDLKVNNNLLKALTCFADNNTLYTVYEDVVGVSLTRYLMENAGELSWEETENLFLPLLYTVKLLNQNGIIHRGISPETIIVSAKKELKLINVCLSGVRANNSEIDPELFVGYAAPEQYQKCTGYGEWTDVYAVSAVLYRTLTGAMPPRSDMRDENEQILPPINLSPKIPKTVSDTIVKGLAYNKNKRINNINDLMGSLYSSEKPEYDESVNSQKEQEKPKKKFRLPIWLIVIL